MQLSGGRLGVQSQRDVGSTFWVELPFGIGFPATDVNRIRSGQSAVKGTPMTNAINLSPMHVQTPRFITPDGQTIPIRPVLHMDISYAQTESPYSEHNGSIRYANGSSESPEGEEIERPSPERLNSRSDRYIPLSLPTEAEGSDKIDDESGAPPLPTIVMMPKLNSDSRDIIKESPTPQETQAVPDSSIEPLVVMVVDDDPLTRLLMTRVCEV